MTQRRLPAAIAMLVLLAGCGTDESVDTSQAATTTATSETAETQTTISANTTGSEQKPQPTATAVDQVTGSLALRADGLGMLRFGEPADSAILRLVQAVGGQPTGDSTITGVMPGGFSGRTVRFVEFGQLSVILSDGTYYRDDGILHFAGWTLDGTDPSELVTPEGITLGSTVDDLRAAFGEQLRLPTTPNECTGTWDFGVGPSELGLEGDLAGPPTDGSSSVIRLGAGAQSSC